MMHARIQNFRIRVLISREKREFMARALEMDLLGHGTTAKEALAELVQAVEAQISFSQFKKDSSMIFFPADPHYFARWEEANMNTLKSQLLGDIPAKMEAAATISFSPRKIKSLRERGFRPAGLVCA
jgi:hypothetical protein